MAKLIYRVVFNSQPSLINLSKKGNSFDNSYSSLFLNRGQQINIVSSYTTPLINEKLFVFENGIIYQNDDFIPQITPLKEGETEH